MGNRIYGCDDCLSVCPWNKFAQATPHAPLIARADLTAPRLADLAQLDDAGFRALFAGSPIKRIGRDRFVRNVLIAMGNSGDRELLPIVSGLLHDPSAVVRGAAVWALSCLDPDLWHRQGVPSRAREDDLDVAAEWGSDAIPGTPSRSL
jgi:epoxyqueuosine reductase